MRAPAGQPSARALRLAAALLSALAVVLAGAASARAQTIAFAPATSQSVGGQPSSVVVADFDGDGRPDLATANAIDDTVSVLRNQGDGTFATLATPATGDDPVSVAVGDFDGDGRPDLVTANFSDGTVSVLRNQGGGAFTTLSTTQAGPEAESVAVGDFDRDGDLDLAVVGLGNGLTVLSNQGDGTFALLSTRSLGTAPISVAVGDFNRDGVPDLAVADYSDGAVTVLRNGGGGTFAPLSTTSVGSQPRTVAVGDLDQDGRPDLVTANSGGGTVTVLRNQGAGTFSTLGTAPAGTTPMSVAIGDFDRDGRPDLAVASSGDSTVSVLRNGGGGSFTAAGTQAVGPSPSSVAVGDFDRDGRPDLATTDSAVSVLRNSSLQPTVGRFETTDEYGTDQSPEDIATADIDRDGDVDLLAADRLSSSVNVLENAGGTVPSQTRVGVGLQPTRVVTGDVDRDGAPDFVAGGGAAIAVVRNGGDGSFGAPTTVALPATVNGLALGDLDRDGDEDLVASLGDGTVVVLANDGAGSFSVSSTTSVGGSPSAIVLADVDGDGRLDVCVTDTDRGRTVVLRGGAAGLSPYADVAVGGLPVSIAAGDLDRDGRIDLLVGDGDGGGLRVLRNTGTGFTSTEVPALAGTSVPDLAVGDVDRDGADDVAVAFDDASRGTGVRWLRNAGDGTLSSAGSSVLLERTSALAPVDLDRDGRLDLAATEAGVNRVALITNQLAPALGVDPTALAFGDQRVSSSAQRTLTLTNSGSGPLTVEGVSTTGTDAGDVATQGGTCDATVPVPVGGSCTVVVGFTPHATGARSATLSIATDALDSPRTVAVSGTGIASAVTFDPTSIAFGAQRVGTTSAVRTVTFSNTGTDTLAISAIAVDDDAFAIDGGTCTVGSTVAADESCTIGVRFAPAAAGAATGALRVTDSAAGSPQSVALTGTGTAPPTPPTTPTTPTTLPTTPTTTPMTPSAPATTAPAPPVAPAPAPVPEADPQLRCVRDGLRLIDVSLVDGRVRISGLALPALARQVLEVRQIGPGRGVERVVGRVVIGADGTYTTTLASPGIRGQTGRVRYFVALGQRRSRALSRTRATLLSDARSASGRVALAGRTDLRTARTAQVLASTDSCAQEQVVRTARVDRRGRFRLTAPAFGTAPRAVYRVRIRDARGRSVSYSLPRTLGR